MNTDTLEAKLHSLRHQIAVADDTARAAAVRENLSSVKFALGMLLGSLVMASEEEDRYSLTSAGLDANSSTELSTVLDTFSWVIRRAYEKAAEIEDAIEALRRINSY